MAYINTQQTDTGGQLCIYHTAALDSSAYIMVSCLYTVA